MPQREITQERSLVYSAWHRPESIVRFLPGRRTEALRMTMIDIDAVYVEGKHPYDRLPIAIMETARIFYTLKPADYHKKSAQILTALGRAANVPVFLVLYECADTPNPADPTWLDIVRFSVKEKYPNPSDKWRIMNPTQFAAFLVALRESHMRIKRHNGLQMAIPFFAPSLLEYDSNDLARIWAAEAQLSAVAEKAQTP